jgi:hypothetical protein
MIKNLHVKYMAKSAAAYRMHFQAAPALVQPVLRLEQVLAQAQRGRRVPRT